MSGAASNRSNVIEQAAMWFAEQEPPPALAVPVLRDRFSMTAREACEALALAQKYRTNRKAFG